jgi:integrase
MGATVRKDGRWWRITLHQLGKRKCWLFQDRRVATLKAKEFDYRLAMEGWGFWEKPADECFGPYAARQLTLWGQGNLKPSTFQLWQYNIQRHVLPKFGALPLNEISRAALKDFFCQLAAQGLRRNTVLNVLTPVRRILQEAVEEGRLVVNPAAGIGRSVLPRNERPFEGKVYTPTQIRQLLHVCKVKSPERYPLLLCLVQTGLRLGEALALEWSDVDWSSGTLTIRGTLFQGQKGLPKNGRFHSLTMTPPLRACFESVYLQRQVERADGPGQLPSWIFCSKEGTPIDGHNLRCRWWKPILEAAQLPPIRLHDLRGSVVSLLLNEGLTPWEVQSYIGHRSLVMTCNTYGHRYPGSSRVEDALAKFLPLVTG